jgi:hypothetical protein
MFADQTIAAPYIRRRSRSFIDYGGVVRRDSTSSGARSGESVMNLLKRTGSFAIVLAGAVAMIAAGCINSDARARKAAATKAIAAPMQSQQPEKPIKMRYYGGPKSPMYPG